MNSANIEDGVVVVGAGLGGIRTIEALRRKQYDGAITLIGNEAHPPYDRPPLSKDVLTGQSGPSRVELASAYRLGELGVRWQPAVAAVGLDVDARRVRLADGSAVAFGALVIATGAVPKMLPGTSSVAGVHVLRTLDDALNLKAAARSARQICVLGAGVLGLEIAASLSELVGITVVEAAAAPLTRALPRGGDVVEVIAAMHESAGVTLQFGTRVTRLAFDNRVTGVELATGERLDADLVVAALGVAPAVEWLAQSGIDLADGVVCDEFNQTNVPGIFALGDVARQVNHATGRSERSEHWTTVVEQAGVVANNVLATGLADFESYQAVPYVWSDQFGRKLQILGRPSEADVEVSVLRDDDDRRAMSLFGRDGMLVGAAVLGLPKQLLVMRRLIEAGTQIDQAAEAAHERLGGRASSAVPGDPLAVTRN